jgi:ubiquinol-cytochrome c reductase cytochrome c1 subunit
MKKLFLLLTLVSMPVFASGGGAHLDAVDIDMNDQASLQRGAGLFVNYCLSCHSAAFML